MELRPHIKLLPSTLEAHHPRLYVCQMPTGHSLNFVWGIGVGYRSAYNNWLDQMKKFA